MSPSEVDTDGDGLSDGYERELGTDPRKPDSDGDGADDRKDVWPKDPRRFRHIPEVTYAKIDLSQMEQAQFGSTTTPATTAIYGGEVSWMDQSGQVVHLDRNGQMRRWTLSTNLPLRPGEVMEGSLECQVLAADGTAGAAARIIKYSEEPNPEGPPLPEYSDKRGYIFTPGGGVTELDAPELPGGPNPKNDNNGFFFGDLNIDKSVLGRAGNEQYGTFHGSTSGVAWLTRPDYTENYYSYLQQSDSGSAFIGEYYEFFTGSPGSLRLGTTQIVYQGADLYDIEPADVTASGTVFYNRVSQSFKGYYWKAGVTKPISTFLNDSDFSRQIQTTYVHSAVGNFPEEPGSALLVGAQILDPEGEGFIGALLSISPLPESGFTVKRLKFPDGSGLLDAARGSSNSDDAHAPLMLAVDNQSSKLLIPGISIKRKGDIIPQHDGVVVEKGKTLEIALTNCSQNNFPFIPAHIVWYQRQLKIDDSWTDWEDMGPHARGVRFDHTPPNGGVFQVKVILQGPSETTVYYIRAHSENQIRNNERYGDGLKDKLDAFGVVDDPIQLATLEKAKGWKLSDHYSLAKRTPARGKFQKVDADLSKCNIFIAHMADDAGAIVPLFNGFLPPHDPPRANQWAGTEITIRTGYEGQGYNVAIPGWELLPADFYPQPGLIVAKPTAKSSPRGSGHCGIIDYDGTPIAAGNNVVHKRKDHNLLTPKSRMRRYDPGYNEAYVEGWEP